MEIRNPFVPLVNLRESFRHASERVLQKSMEDEDADYVAAKHRYDRANSGWGMVRLNSGLKTALDMSGDERFLSKQEYLDYREDRSLRLLWAYQQLLTIPEEEPVSVTPDVEALIATLGKGGMKQGGKLVDWDRMNPYWKSIVSSYGRGICDKFGTLKMMDSAQVPLGVVNVMKHRKVRRQS